jgi:predicted RNA-binding Zn-ribbon protein involved in translation (DUF1610 family)
VSRPYKGPSGRIHLRGGGARFRRSTLADMGLAAEVCEACRALLPRALGEVPPETCPHCGVVIVRERCAWSRVREGAFLDPRLFREGAYQPCGAPAVAWDLERGEGRCAEHIDAPQEADR